MKKLYLLFAFLVIGFSVQASSVKLDNLEYRGNGEAFIFTEAGVEFAVFPDGQFDFFYKPRRVPAGYVNAHGTHITFNSGYNYDPFVQYDDFGAVIQIENVSVFYDYYGRIIQAGRVKMSYNHFGMLSRVGNLFLHYNPHNHYTHFTGYINAHNPQYVYRPWHDHYRRPNIYQAVVFHQPYRAYYDPYRLKYSQHKKYYKKHTNTDFRRSYYRPGDQISSYQKGRRVDAPKTTRSDAAPARTDISTTRPHDRYGVRQAGNYETRSENTRAVRSANVQRVRPQKEIRAVRSSRGERNEAPAARVVEENVQRQRQNAVQTPRQLRETRQEKPQVRTSRTAETVQSQGRQTSQSSTTTSRSSRGRD